jgi:putative membrane protein
MQFFKSFLLQVAVGVLGLFLADYFLDGVYIKSTEFLFYGGFALGIVNFFIRPIIRLITFPLRLLTLGLFTFFINVAIVWFIQAMFPEINIEGYITLLYATLIVWVMEFVIHTFAK